MLTGRKDLHVSLGWFLPYYTSGLELSLAQCWVSIVGSDQPALLSSLFVKIPSDPALGTSHSAAGHSLP